MNIADRDIYLIHIEKEIEIRRKRLLEKQQKMQHIISQNHFCENKDLRLIKVNKIKKMWRVYNLKKFIHRSSIKNKIRNEIEYMPEIGIKYFIAKESYEKLKMKL